MKETGVIPVFYHEDEEVCTQVLHVAYEAGIRVFEFVMRGENAEKNLSTMLEYGEKYCPEMIIGVGSVVSGVQAELLIDKGASFVVTAALRKDVGEICNEFDILWVPGCGTLTEIVQAEDMGCQLVKLFPASVYGPEFIKAVQGPQPWTNIMPNGGVSPDEDNLKSWFDAGAYCVGIGSALLDKDLIKAQKYAELQYKIGECLRVVNGLK